MESYSRQKLLILEFSKHTFLGSRNSFHPNEEGFFLPVNVEHERNCQTTGQRKKEVRSGNECDGNRVQKKR